jgi:hypothetical protein
MQEPFFLFQDQGSGLRSVSEFPQIIGGFNENDAYYSYENFVVGSTLPYNYYYTANCCQEEVAITVSDVAGNKAVCRAGPGVGPDDANSLPNVNVQEAGISGLTVGLIVMGILLLLVIIGAITAILLIKNKRKVELEEMRQTPQAR